MAGPISSDACSPSSPANCRWAQQANLEANESNLVDLPPSEQVSRGKELLSLLQEVAFPIGETSENTLPPPPGEMPPAPPGFEVPSAGFNHGRQHSGDFNHGRQQSGDFNHGRQQSGDFNHGRQHSGDWAASPCGTPPAGPQHQHHFAGQQQTHFASSRSSTPGSAQGMPAVWGNMGGGMNNGASGTWAPLSTNPSSMSGGWLSTGVSENDGSSLAMSSPHSMAHNGHSSASSAHVPYSMPASTNVGNGLWSGSSGQTITASAGMIMAPSLMASAGLMQPMMQAQQPNHYGQPNGLRAEATPYVPMNMGVGVQVY